METLESPEVGAIQPYTDTEGITHIYVLDFGMTYVRIDGEWVEMPF